MSAVGFPESVDDDAALAMGEDEKKVDVAPLNLAAIKHIAQGLQFLTTAEVVALSSRTRASGRHLLYMALLHATSSGEGPHAVHDLLSYPTSAVPGTLLAFPPD